jgi:hypothetical protein
VWRTQDDTLHSSSSFLLYHFTNRTSVILRHPVEIFSTILFSTFNYLASSAEMSFLHNQTSRLSFGSLVLFHGSKNFFFFTKFMRISRGGFCSHVWSSINLSTCYVDRNISSSNQILYVRNNFYGSFRNLDWNRNTRPTFLLEVCSCASWWETLYRRQQPSCWTTIRWLCYSNDCLRMNHGLD